MSCSLPILSIFMKMPSYWLFRKNLLVRLGILSATALSKPIIKCLGDGGRATFNLDPAFGSLETRGCKLDHRLYCTRRQVFNPVDCFLKVEISISYLKLTTFFIKVLNPSFGLLAIRKHEQPWAAFLHCDGQWWPERAHPPSTRCVDAASPAACTQLRYLPVQAGPAVIRPSEDTLRASIVPDARDSFTWTAARADRSLRAGAHQRGRGDVHRDSRVGGVQASRPGQGHPRTKRESQALSPGMFFSKAELVFTFLLISEWS